jgi:hypothetical protein
MSRHHSTKQNNTGLNIDINPRNCDKVQIFGNNNIKSKLDSQRNEEQGNAEECL